MNNKTRCMVVFLVSLAVLFSSAFTVCAADVEWKMATKMPPTSAEGKAFQKFADLVKEKSKGKMVINVYPAEQLGKTEATIELLKAGVIQVYPEGSGYLQKFVPEMKYSNLPFLFDDRDHWVRFMDSDMVQGWLNEVAAKDNVMVLGKVTDFLRGPYRVMVSKKPVKTLDDVNGLKLRLHPDDVAIAVWKHLGANPIVLPWTEIYESLGRGIIQGCNSPIALVEGMKFYEKAKNIIRHDEFPQGMAFMTNYKQFQALSPDLQKAVLDAHKEASAYSVDIMNEVAKESIGRMEKTGVTYSVIDRQPFVKRLNELYVKWEAEGQLPKGFLKMVSDLSGN